MTRAWRCLLAALLVLPVTAVAGEIRQWVDADGRLHFGDEAVAPGRSQAVAVTRGNFLPAAPGTAAGTRLPEAAPAGADLMARAMPADAGAASAPAPAATPASGTPDCPPVEYKKISPRTGLIMRMRRFPCLPGLAPVELGPL